jgi:hypothetical protein
MKPPLTIDVSLPGYPPRWMFAVTMPEVVNTTMPHPRQRASRASRQSRTVKNSQADTVPAAEDADDPPPPAEAPPDQELRETLLFDKRESTS